MKTRAELITDSVKGLAIDLLYYDRKEDSELMRGDIEDAIECNEITAEHIVEVFRKELEALLEQD